jgi:cysteinyl-tRNA synthetase
LNRALDEVKKIHEFVLDARSYKASGNFEAVEISDCIEKMKEELSNDFNSAGAMGHFFSFMRVVRHHKEQLSPAAVSQIHLVIQFVQEALGLVSTVPENVLKELRKHEQDTTSTGVNADWIEKMLADRTTAKATKNWARADEIRKVLTEKNIVLKDNPDGTTSWSVKD